MSERLQFIQACLDRREKIVDICDRFGISEKTGHKWLARFRAGDADLGDRSHAPHSRDDLVAPAVAARILTLRRQHPLYGAAKLRDWLVQNEPGTRWPAASTMGALFQRAGLIRRPRRSRSMQPPQLPHGRTVASAPNVVWTADFKGQFRLGTGAYCYPLTVLDLHTHFLLGCTAQATTAVRPTRQSFTRLFREHGLPEVLRTDNGVPFAQPNAAGRLGALGFWWVRLGIRPEHIRPARPAENGAHERFHKTLKAHTIQPASRSPGAQQKRFDRFRLEYNHERPHESTPGRRPPGSLYVSSARSYPSVLPPLLYPGASAVRLVDSSGLIKWRGVALSLSRGLSGELVGLTESDADRILVHYGQLSLGSYDPHTQRFTSKLEWESTRTP
jgi:transposase InsO family protein